MSDRYTTRPHSHKILGPVVEVLDTKHQIVASIYTGPYAEERADQRAREMNAEDEKSNRD